MKGAGADALAGAPAGSAGLSAAMCATLAAVTYADVPPAARTAARHALLDASGVMLAASGQSADVAPFIRVAQRGGPGPCAILGTGHSSGPALAALANGAMAHALDYEDAFDAAPGHPNASLVPALIALAQSDGPVDGRHFLTSLAVGGDFACRMALALRRDMALGGWYPPPMLAAFGAAVGCAHLLRLPAAAMCDALSLMLCQAVAPGQITHSATGIIRAVREGFPAQAAVNAALLAREGVRGFDAPIEGAGGFYALYANGCYDPAVLRAGLGQHYWTAELTFKPWPSCRGTHPFIEMALALRAQHGFCAQDVASIAVDVDDVQTMLTSPAARKCAPATVIDAKFSIPFALALALVRGRVALDDFCVDALGDAALLDMAARVQARVAPRPGWQRGSGGAMRVMLRDGRVLDAAQDDALGCPARPLSPARLTEKFVDCVGRAARPIPPDIARALAARVLCVDDCADVGALFAAG
ncbi:MAG: MmgE/PrpD family protein [Sphingopyxis sp.]